MKSRRSRLNGGTVAPLVTGALVAVGSGAAAQTGGLGDQPAINQVLSRARPGYDAIGIPIGGLRLYPEATLSAGYDDNIFNLPAATERDAVIAFVPTARLRSDWSRHALTLDGDARIERLPAHPSQDNSQYGASAAGRYDVSRRVQLTAMAGARRAVEARGTSGDTVLGGEPVRFGMVEASGGVSATMGRITASGMASYDRLRFDDVRVGQASVSQGYRNADLASADAQLSYWVGPSISLFGSGSVNRQRARAGGDASLDNQGFGILAGAQFTVTRVISARVGGGYFRQTFAGPLYAPAKGANYNLMVTWNPTPLLTLSATGARAVVPSPLIGVGGIVNSTANLRADYELLRNVIVDATVGYNADEYRGIDRKDNRIAAGLGARYLLNRQWSTALRIDHRRQSGASTFSRRYAGTGISLALTVRR